MTAFRIRALMPAALIVGLTGCLPTQPIPMPVMTDPSMGMSAEEMSRMTGGVMPPMSGPAAQAQCNRSAAIMSNPTSTANERYGATTAARANGCPGY